MADAGTGRENTIAMGQVLARERKRKRGAADVKEGKGRRKRSQREPSIEEPTTATLLTTTMDRRVRANSRQQQASTARDDRRPVRQVQFAVGQVEIDGLEGLKQQLER
jgi:hypothetical protein